MRIYNLSTSQQIIIMYLFIFIFSTGGIVLNQLASACLFVPPRLRPRCSGQVSRVPHQDRLVEMRTLIRMNPDGTPDSRHRSQPPVEKRRSLILAPLARIEEFTSQQSLLEEFITEPNSQDGTCGTGAAKYHRDSLNEAASPSQGTSAGGASGYVIHSTPKTKRTGRDAGASSIEADEAVVQVINVEPPLSPVQADPRRPVGASKPSCGCDLLLHPQFIVLGFLLFSMSFGSSMILVVVSEWALERGVCLKILIFIRS